MPQISYTEIEHVNFCIIEVLFLETYETNHGQYFPLWNKQPKAKGQKYIKYNYL